MADTASERTRGVANRGVESNVGRGEVHTIIPGKAYNVIGFDIGKADLKKPGFEKELEPVVKQLQREHKEFNDGKRATHPVVTVTGHASESVRPGKGPQAYASNRADAVKRYLVARDIPPEWIHTSTSRESPQRSGSVGASSERKALARSATIEVGENENLARAAHQRGLENRYGDPPEYLTAQQYKRLPRPNLAPPVKMSRLHDMVPAQTKWQWPQPPLVTQISEVDCWAATLSSWLDAVQSPNKTTQRALIEQEQKFGGLDTGDFGPLANRYGMNASVRLKRSDFTPERIEELLAISPLVFSSNQSKGEEDWWHNVVIFGVKVRPSGKSSYAIMDPGPRGEVLNLAQAQSLAGSQDAKYVEVSEKYLFPEHGTGEWIVGWSKKSVKR